MGDIDFDALDKAVNQQMNNVKKETRSTISDLNKKEQTKSAKRRGIAMDIISKSDIPKRNNTKKVAIKTSPAKNKVVSRNNNSSKTINDVFRTSKDKNEAVTLNKIHQQNCKTLNNSKKSVVNPVQANHKLRERRRLHQPVNISKDFSVDNGKLIGHYESQTVSKHTRKGDDVIYKKDSLDYVASLPNNKNTSELKYQENKIITKIPTKTIKPEKVAKVKKDLNSENKPTTPFLKTANVEKRPLGVPEENYYPTTKHQALKIEDKIEDKETTALYRADAKIADLDNDINKKKSNKKLNFLAWFFAIISISGFAILIFWILNYS